MGLLFSRTVTRLPLLEPLGFRLAGAANQGVEAVFVDDTDIGVPTINFRIPEVILLIFIQTTESFGDVVQSKRVTHILRCCRQII
jgi:hypothetical protein